MKEGNRRSYIEPSCIIVPISLMLNAGWGDNQGDIGFGTGSLPADMGQGKGSQITESADVSLWDDDFAIEEE